MKRLRRGGGGGGGRHFSQELDQDSDKGFALTETQANDNDHQKNENGKNYWQNHTQIRTTLGVLRLSAFVCWKLDNLISSIYTEGIIR